VQRLALGGHAVDAVRLLQRALSAKSEEGADLSSSFCMRA